MNGILPGAGRDSAGGHGVLDIRGQRGARRARIGQHAGERRCDDRRRSGQEALREEFAPRARPGVVLMAERFVQFPQL